ncbi:GNAT family N-acetyltransferase [Mesorhizobium sp. NZP2077]|uniref:GNAT family N-acetyltransferase n=1 Tax=Mesorhizobium sp. NZP2077 TaxID=2483404 RepID=UPI001553906E|nr:GNAT family N-acetyltransferase [Mesorhizobium sp. NZP2077]QKC82715.1 GNAT family N-acetyltransferase [Mesorhizobium sp. NZP2077]QKD16211.1 GNAT family N-acetyltransferase [Mesorhizobium sp. NZP2077]
MDYTVRSGIPADDPTLIRHYRALWESYGVDPANIKDDAEDVTLNFILSGRRDYELASFFAEADGVAVGSLACQVEHLPYPDVTVPSFRKHGYIWSVFVEPGARRNGVAAALVQAGIDYLKSIGCTKAVLHASDAGEGVYLAAGFTIAKEMRLDLAEQQAQPDRVKR